MYKLSFLLAFVPFFLAAQSNPKIAPELRGAFNNGETPDALVVFREKADVSAASTFRTKAQKGRYVFDVLRQHAERTQRDVRIFLANADARANSFYLVNAISVKSCTPNLAQQLAQFNEIEAIVLDPQVALHMPEKHTSIEPRNGVEWGIAKINAEQAWAAGYTGQGVVVGGADTGYDWEHPAIRPHYNGVADNGNVDHNYNWHDAIHQISPLNADSLNPCGLNLGQPCDDQSHGTHTMGTMTGDDGQGNQIGVAPSATWVGCRNMERGWGQPSTYIECFEWFLAPTDLNGLNPLPEKAPDVINNSWYCAVSEGCTDLSVNELMRQAIINLKAAGVVVVVSNGNFGSQGCNSTYGPPAYFGESFSVGSTQESDTISNFSSRGPVTIDASNRIKPDVSAPGQFVRSCTPNNNYAHFSGTSMAGPHVVGLVALMFSANPNLKGDVARVEQIIKETCLKLDGLADCSDNNGLDYPNNTYGFGRVDAWSAVQMAIASDVFICYGIENTYVSPNPTSGQVHFSSDMPNEAATWTVTDISGRIIFHRNVDPRPYSHIYFNENTSNWGKGIFFWELKTVSGVTRNGRLVVH
jgi:serine protease AprX